MFEFDGVVWNNHNVGNGLPHNRVYGIAAGSDGSVWAATFDGVARFDGVRWRSYGVSEGLGTTKAYQIGLDEEGRVWVTHPNGVLSN